MTDDANEPAEIDLEALDLGPMLRHARTATFAPNWRAVLAADALVGLVICVVGVLLAQWSGWAGWPVVAVGAIYLFLVMRRFLQWRWLRERAGL